MNKETGFWTFGKFLYKTRKFISSCRKFFPEQKGKFHWFPMLIGPALDPVGNPCCSIVG